MRNVSPALPGCAVLLLTAGMAFAGPDRLFSADESTTLAGEPFRTIGQGSDKGKWRKVWSEEDSGGVVELWVRGPRSGRWDFDPFELTGDDFGIGPFKVIRRLPFIEPAEEDIGYGSSRHPHLWGTGRSRRNAYIVGKGNRFDHRYRFLARIPLDTLLPKGRVRKAELQFQLKLFAGSEPSRVYLVESIDGELLKLKANDLNAGKVSLLGKVELGRENVSLPVPVDMTDAVNHALAEVWSGVTIRIRPEYEPNDDPGASGAAIDPCSVRMYYTR